jgi:hypothetical protein
VGLLQVTRNRLSGLLLPLSLAVVLCPASARADEGKESKACIKTDEEGLKLQSQGHLASAKERFARCATDACPEVVRKECARLVTEVAASMPTVVFAATDAKGNDLVEAKVFLDGKLLLGRLGGDAVPVDPGVHSARFVSRTGVEKGELFVARAGEKNRRFVVKLQTPPPTGAPSHHAKDSGAAHTSGSGTSPIAYVLLGVAAVSVGAFSYFAATGKREQNQVEKCAPDCSDAQYEAMRNRYLAADISLGVGVLSGVGAAYFFLSTPGTAPATTGSQGRHPAAFMLGYTGRF